MLITMQNFIPIGSWLFPRMSVFVFSFFWGGGEVPSVTHSQDAAPILTQKMHVMYLLCSYPKGSLLFTQSNHD